MNFNPTITRSLKAAALIWTAAALLAGCALLGRRPTAEEQAAAARARPVLANLQARNAGLEKFKGIGRIKIQKPGQGKINARLAWIAWRPDRLRVAVLVSGFAAVKIATDGKWFYYYDSRSRPPVYRKFMAGNASLERVVGIGIRTRDIIDLLAGRVPLHDHSQALLIAGEGKAKEGGAVLVLKKRWAGIIEKVHLDESRSGVAAIEFFSGSGRLAYRVRLAGMHSQNGYRLPGRLEFSNGDGTEVVLDISAFQAGIDVTERMFVLPPPG